MCQKNFTQSFNHNMLHKHQHLHPHRINKTNNTRLIYKHKRMSRKNIKKKKDFFLVYCCVSHKKRKKKNYDIHKKN